MKYIALLLIAFALLTGCEQQGPLEEAGESMDDAAEEMGDAVENATD